jgi:heptaprenyl diphosphate synthase
MKKAALTKTTFISLLIAFSLITYFIESLLPPLIPGVSGARLGLSNIFILYALYAFGWKDAVFIAVIKSILGPIFAGYPAGMFFAIGGSILSLTTMALIKGFASKRFGLIGVSIAGAVMHNAGQVMIAMLFTSTAAVGLQFPILAIVAVPCGIITGIAADRLLKITSSISLKNKKKSVRRKSL